MCRPAAARWSCNCWAGHPCAYGEPLADAVQLQQIVGQGSSDDNFQVKGVSPTVDAGDPASPYLAEPAPNGGRVNQGYDGNTAEATPSLAQLVQVLSPTTLDKVQVGQPVTVSWRSDGLTATRPVAFINVGGSAGRQLAARQLSDGGRWRRRLVHRSGGHQRRDPSAPQAVYQSYAQASYGVGNQLA